VQEIIFRGLLAQADKRTNTEIAALISSVLFAGTETLIMYGFSGNAYVFLDVLSLLLMGFALCVIRYKTNSLLPTFLISFAWAICFLAAFGHAQDVTAYVYKLIFSIYLIIYSVYISPGFLNQHHKHV
ncbi:MAG TPA: CPBP family intramembrane glutamic endopeptidase, partial [Patescibacteria group bacterium]|nr:CPBP family intramembrane glutamic endopeptidase [Patescibacteria group bacterium]